MNEWRILTTRSYYKGNVWCRGNYFLALYVDHKYVLGSLHRIYVDGRTRDERKT